jgi:MOSC domain-containing protein YiiM
MNASADFAAASIDMVRIGGIAPLGPDAVPSGFVKSPVAGPVVARTLGLDGDAQADLSVHGGPDKAVYAYATRHYPDWAADYPDLAAALLPGSMGENLCITGLDETQVHIGDTIRHGGAVLQVTQPRQPCFKLALAFEQPRMVRTMTRSGRSGWYFRVIADGPIAAGDTLQLLERPNPGWSVARFNAMLLQPLSPGLKAELAALARLAATWRARFSDPDYRH